MVNVLGYRQQAYRKSNEATASPASILLQLYDGAIRFVDQAIAQIKDGKAGPKGESLGKAHAIITEFINALDHKQSPELCENLEGVYTFMLEQIAKANLDMDPQPLVPVLKHLKSMRETWQTAINESAQQQNDGANHQNGIGSAL